jgi:hypothetical protein
MMKMPNNFNFNSPIRQMNEQFMFPRGFQNGNRNLNTQMMNMMGMTLNSMVGNMNNMPSLNTLSNMNTMGNINPIVNSYE